MSTKVCNGCQRALSADAFYLKRDKAKSLGARDSKCKSCRNRSRCAAAVLSPAAYNPERNRADWLKRWNDPRRREDKLAYSRDWIVSNPEKRAAHLACARAKRAGALVVPRCCERCGKEARLDAHHADYSKPLDVEWLCRRCHRRA